MAIVFICLGSSPVAVELAKGETIKDALIDYDKLAASGKGVSVPLYRTPARTLEVEFRLGFRRYKNGEKSSCHQAKRRPHATH